MRREKKEEKNEGKEASKKESAGLNEMETMSYKYPMGNTQDNELRIDEIMEASSSK
jgi:hypothetical protein